VGVVAAAVRDDWPVPPVTFEHAAIPITPKLANKVMGKRYRNVFTAFLHTFSAFEARQHLFGSVKRR
jgi:hypothetical protein